MCTSYSAGVRARLCLPPAWSRGVRAGWKWDFFELSATSYGFRRRRYSTMHGLSGERRCRTARLTRSPAGVVRKRERDAWADCCTTETRIREVIGIGGQDLVVVRSAETTQVPVVEAKDVVNDDSSAAHQRYSW